MTRPTIALSLIAKNEEHNLPILIESVKGCFDKIYLTDTGSTDNTVEVAKALGCEVRHFDWIYDFSAARNASFENIKEDYVAWMDCDDSMLDPEAFKMWRDTVMNTADYWVATYHYASDPQGNPACSFARERVVKNDGRFFWKYFIHEGIMPKENLGAVRSGFVKTWAVKHRRTPEDLARDKGRNLQIFEKHKDSLDARMKFYYGKEFFENGDPTSAVKWLLNAITEKELEPHDRLLGIQYCASAMLQIDKPSEAINVAFQGIHLDPNRAEFWTVISDSFMKQGKLMESVPFLNAAKSCYFHDVAKTGVSQPLFSHKDSYTSYPRNQLARVYANIGRFDEAKKEAKDCLDLFPNADSIAIVNEVEKVLALQSACAKPKNTSDDIVISGVPNAPYEWDWEIYKQRGIGGSETAAVEMAYWMNKLSGRRVKVFNNRKTSRFFDGVEYHKTEDMPKYFSDNKPYAHVAWRHNFKLTDAPTYVWCHDIMTLGGEQTHYTKMLALSEFHKNYLMAIQGIPENKIRVTRNGIDPTRFGALKKERKPIVVWRSSPDRGLERAINVMKEVRKVHDLELHVFYGFDNMYKIGANEHADRIKAEIAKNDFVKMIGNVTQKELTDRCSESMIWLYPTDFTETFCISAIESICEGVYPVVRRFGALQDTLDKAVKEGMCSMLDLDCVTPNQISLYADEVIDAVDKKKWKNVAVDPRQYSWESVGVEWLKMFEEDRHGPSA